MNPHFHYAALQCRGEYGMIPFSLLIWAQSATTGGYGLFRKPLVATRMNED